MSENNIDFQKLKILTDRQQAEAGIHWTRNNVFLICSSILLLAFSQFMKKPLQISVASLGFVINFAWLLVQYRSSKYIQHYKAEVQKITPDIYPKDLKGIEMRLVAFVFPIAFMAIWVAILIISVI